MTFKSKTAAFVAGVAGFAVALSFVVTPVTASAQSVADLQSQIAALLAQIAQLQGMVGGGSTSTGGSAPVAPLTLGSSGAQVTALQNWLISKGYAIPAGATGYFGAQTQSAVAAFQAANGISPAAGYYGPMTAAKVASMMGPVVVVPPTTGGTMDGTDGTATVSYNGFAPTSQVIKKGETKNVIAVRVQASNGPVTVNRFSFNLGGTNARPWLYFSKATLKNSNGNIIAEKTLTGPSDATEVSVGSEYQINFNNVNQQVQPGTGNETIFVVELTTLAASDKFPATLYAAVPSGAIRTVNGKGYTDSIGLSSSAQGGAANNTYGNTISLTSTGSVADIYTSVSPSTPQTGFVTVGSGTTRTENVTLGVYRIKAQNTSGTLTGVNFNLGATGGPDAAGLFSEVSLSAGGRTYYATSLATTTTFTNMTVPLPLDQWVDVTLKATVAGADIAAGAVASSTMLGSTITGYDSNFSALTVSNAGSVTSNALTFLQSGLNVQSSSVDSLSCQGTSPTACTATFRVTLMNNGNNPLYISRTPGVALATSSTVSSSTITVVTANPAAGEVPGDSNESSASFAILNGSSRTFTFTGALSKPAGGGTSQLAITGIKFGTGAANGTSAGQNAQYTLTSGLGGLTQVNVF